MNILIVPDGHASPDTDNRRFTWLGRLILDKRPDIIINLGDLWDMNSLCSYDRNKKSFEGRRYNKDIAAGVDALKRMNAPFKEHNEKQKNIRKAKLKEPRKIITLGNHEFRILRAIENSPELDGLLNMESLQLKENGYEVYPFKQPICVEGIWVSHYFSSGTKGEAISGSNIGASLLAKNMVSSICGHSHLWDMAIRSRPDGTKAIGISAGWYGEEATYADATDQLWWSGVTMLYDVYEGNFDAEQISIERIKANYG